jgi:AcrR family transcriptional regulator
MTNIKRAYSEEAKQQREDKIILAAQALLLERGYHVINMDQVAQAAGLAKGTVYLYFRTKEALFLTVFERQAAAWADEIAQTLAHNTGDSSQDGLIDVLVTSLADKPLLTRLVALTPIIFEYNITLEQARDHKLWVFGNLDRIGALIDTRFHLRQMQGIQLLYRMFMAVAGLDGFAHPSPITQQVYAQEATIPRVDFASELRHFLKALLKLDADEG